MQDKDIKNHAVLTKKQHIIFNWNFTLTLFCSSICSALLTLFKWCTLIRPLSLF